MCRAVGLGQSEDSPLAQGLWEAFLGSCFPAQVKQTFPPAAWKAGPGHEHGGMTERSRPDTS